MEGFAHRSRWPGTVQDMVVAVKMLCLVAILHRLKGESHVPSQSKCRLSYEDTLREQVVYMTEKANNQGSKRQLQVMRLSEPILSHYH